jgi:hypothetical protein
VDTFFDKQNKPLPPEFAKELVYFDDKTNNFYYRSSPYFSGTTSQRFIGRPTTGLISPVNKRNLLFPTTIINLGIKDDFYQEIIFDPSAKGYIMNTLNPTSYSDTSDLVNLFVISRITDEGFLSQLIPAGNNGLNQLFRVPSNGNPRTDIIRRVNSIEEIGGSVLSEVNVDQIINDIISDKYKYHDNLGFFESMELFKDAYINKTYLNWPTNFSACKKCEFKTTIDDEINGLQSGFKHCFQRQFGWNNEQFDAPNAMEIWNYRGKNLMEEHRLLLQDVTEEDFNVVPVAGKISSSERQWIQVEKARSNDSTIYVEKEGLQDEMNKWKFPLHFIDFETSTVALPFTTGRKPYEQVAFQFSHHMYHIDGTITHETEFISNTPGEFPNFIFARALYNALKNDDGSIFRFAAHENSILNAIIEQLKQSNEPDKEELLKFLKSITNSTKNSVEQWSGERTMIDLNKVIKDYYYNPHTKGSNSIKAVLPAALNSSQFLQAKYGMPLHNINVTSKNFDENHIWLRIENNEVINPYKMLPPLFEGWNELELADTISEVDTISDGGAALTAYAKLQYQDMTEIERTEITIGLLKYCELDTLAMVMIYEHLKEICGNDNF